MMDDLSGIEAVIFIRHAHERLQILRSLLIKSRYFWSVSLFDCYRRGDYSLNHEGPCSTRRVSIL